MRRVTAEAGLLLAVITVVCCWLIGFTLPFIFGAGCLVAASALIAVVLP